MSSEATAWAFRQNIPASAVKFTLVALCECANFDTGMIYPSIARITEMTGQNRKTIIANVAKLEAMGLLVDTGERTGQTKQIKVYRVSMQTVAATVPKVEQSQKRNSSVFTRKQSQKRDTEPSREPSSKSNIARALPADWKPVLTAASQAIVSRWPPGRLETELDAFRDHAADKGRTSKDWQAAFRTWITNSEKWNPTNGTANRQPAPRYPNRDKRDGFAKALDAIIDGGGIGSPAGYADRSADDGFTGDGGLPTARVITLRPTDVRQGAADDASGPAHAVYR